MDCKKLCVVILVTLSLWGCAAPKADNTVAQMDQRLWQDQEFAYDRGLVTETRESLFALDADVMRALHPVDGVGHSTERRLDLLVARLYGPTGIRLSYASGHSTGASQTWHNKRGDCLSLTILAYAAARFVGVDAQMQEVQVPVAVDRRDGVDYVNGHVNVVVRHATEITIDGQSRGAGDLIIDFEPQVGSRRSGLPLTERGIMARFYNNRATEYLVQKDDARAYAYFRAAAAAAPEFAPSFSNLATLYARRGLLPQAEGLLLHAIALSGPSYAPLRAMHQLLTEQGRTAQAQYYADLLARRQDEDPYHWLALGMGALGEGRNAAAIRALERAASLTTGFEELHYYLGVAYWRNGQQQAANKQLAALSAINEKDPSVAILSKKLQGMAPRS